jgi:AcrR family transcriptional regulator
MSASEKTQKAEETRRRILDAALELLRERGYEKATMRAIAGRAGVSVGNAYYYFASKEALVQAFYARTHAEHLEVAEPRLTRQRTLKGRLLASMQAKLETIEPYHPFAGVLFKSAADPKSPLNPFSAESGPVRDEAMSHFAHVVEGSKLKVPADLAAELPFLLWTWHMSIILFWIHDESPGHRRTHLLMERTSDLVAKLVSVSSMKLMTPLRRSTLKLLRDLRAA